MVDNSLILIGLFGLGFIMGVSLASWRLKNKVKAILDELKVHYKVIDEEQHEHLQNRYGTNKDTWMSKGINKMTNRKKGSV